MGKDDTSNNAKKRKQRYLPQNKPVKKKGAYPLHPGVQGFFITCDGGREIQASRDAISILDSFYEDLVCEKPANADSIKQNVKLPNKRIKFTYSDDEEDEANEGSENRTEKSQPENGDEVAEEQIEPADGKNKIDETVRVESLSSVVAETKSFDKLIEEELNELGDRDKRMFSSLDSGCNGVVFIQMRKSEGGPSPAEVALHMMKSAASTRKHISRFLLRVIPIEASCYSSEEEIKKAISPLVKKYFPDDAPDPVKFAVLYEARANTGVDRTSIIDVVAKSVPSPHKVDLTNPEKTIVVEIARTVCLIGVVEKYKEFSKYNIRQLTS